MALTAGARVVLTRSPPRRRRPWETATRSYAVKELPWCSGDRQLALSERNKQKTSFEYNFKPIDNFGVVAAMSLNRVIGVNGSLPWEKLDQDRKIFTDLTTDKLIILGRETFQEQPDLSHIKHASSSIVVSTTMNKEDLCRWETMPLALKIARSLSQALHIARVDCADQKTEPVPGDPVQCWVVGGERLYNEAVMHRSLEEIHLSVVNQVIDERPENTTRRFPPKYRWDHKFRLVEQKQYDSFHYYKYVRNQGFV